jgi:flagellar protein FlaJ
MIKLELQNQIIIISAAIGILLFLLNFLFFFSNLISLIAIVFVLMGPGVLQYFKYHESKEIENRFPDFLGDVARSIKSGMTLIQAIKATKNTNYGSLTPSIKKIVNQVDWGIPFDKVLANFSKNSTRHIKRTISTIIETHREGGDIADVLENVGVSSAEINKLREERSTGVYSQMITGYIVFFVFIGVLIALQKLFVPNIASFSTAQLSLVDANVMTQIYKDVFQWLILIQGFFSGLVIGKLTEGRIVAGLKHCLILILVGFSIFVLI